MGGLKYIHNVHGVGGEKATAPFPCCTCITLPHPKFGPPAPALLPKGGLWGLRSFRVFCFCFWDHHLFGCFFCVGHLHSGAHKLRDYLPIPRSSPPPSSPHPQQGTNPEVGLAQNLLFLLNFLYLSFSEAIMAPQG